MPTLTRRHILSLGAALAAPALLRATPARADIWPSRSIRVIVPYSAGSATDIIARIVLESVAPRLGQTILVENRGGAGPRKAD